MREDEELLAAWQHGNKAAGQELFARYFPIVYRFLRNKVADEIDDLVQRTFLACARHRDRLHGGATFRAFVLVVARNELARYLRSRYRGGEQIDPATTSLADLGATPSQLVARRDEHRMLLLALHRIALQLQEIIELSYFEQLTGPELAVVLEIPEGTVRSRLRRAHAALRAQVERMAASPELVESTLGSLATWAEEMRALSTRIPRRQRGS